jgi:predicted carbohydrate-binding protein with CBM5 and CBM33 domain
MLLLMLLMLMLLLLRPAPADAPEEPQQVCVLDHLSALVTHGAHELEQPDGRICTAGDRR